MSRGRDWERSAKEDAPTRREYRDLLRAAKRLDGDEKLRYTFTVRTMGELGLRAGEVCHLHREWLDLERGRIKIPSHDPCDHGRNGDVCGYCKSQSRDALEHRPDDYTLEDELETRWKPKLEASSRTVFYDFDDELYGLFDMFFHRHKRYPWCRSSINRLVNDLVEECDLIDDKDRMYPHAFRGHAASRFAREGMRAHTLRRYMGWGSVEAALEYIRMEADDVKEQLSRLDLELKGYTG